MRVELPRLIVAGLAGDSGKTLVTLGLARALADRGLCVRAFKKGPDYIDAAWLGAATGAPCRNLDTFLMPAEAIDRAMASAAGADLGLVEGNRGLYDGFDAAGSHSTAELAKALGAPVLLVVDITKMTRTAAALVLGAKTLDPKLRIAGVVLNQVATSRQERLVRDAVETSTGIPVVGAVARLRGGDPLPTRHLGLVTAAEHSGRVEAIGRAAEAVRRGLDLDRVLAAAREAAAFELPLPERVLPGDPVRIGILRDEAFTFYYPENLESLEAAGAELIPLSPLGEGTVPELDGLYIGGGFPEVHAARLAGGTSFAAALRSRVARGLPVYAECGGLMYLARELVVGGAVYPMAGVLDLVVEQTDHPQGHGYEVGVITRPNPFFPEAVELKGHEFHYSRVAAGGGDKVLQLSRGCGLGGGRDGLVQGRVWASYMHLHAGATPAWADGFLALSRRYAAERTHPQAAWA